MPASPEVSSVTVSPGTGLPKASATRTVAPEVVTPSAVAEGGRIEALEQAVNALRAELVDLRTQLDEFRKQFQ
jgi:hypothetical protein